MHFLAPVIQLAVQAPESSLDRAAAIAQVIVGVGAIVSLVLAAWSVREVRRDRQFRVRPRLLFDHGGEGLSFTEEPLRGIPGIDVNVARALLEEAHLLGEPGLLPKSLWGRLRNYGDGSALNVIATFITLQAQIGTEWFDLDQAKLRSFPYDPILSRIPGDPSHLVPSAETKFFRIPTPIFVGESQRRSGIEGVVAIQYTDVFDHPFVAFQIFRARVIRDAPQSPYILMTFAEELTRGEATEALARVAPALPPELRP